MKILIYASSLSYGGAERVASLWANGFVQKGHEVCLMLNSFSSSYDYKISKEIRVRKRSLLLGFLLNKLPAPIKKSRIISIFLDKFFCILPSIIRKRCIANVLKRESPNVIIVVMQGLFLPIHDALKVIKKNIPIIVTDHNSYERPDCAPFSEKRYKEKFKDVSQYDYMTVLTEADKKVLVKKFDSTFMEKVFVLPNPLTYNPVKNIPQKKNIILAAGRINAWHYKGFDLLLKAWSMIQNEFPNWTLRIAGGGDTTPLERICNELNISNRVEFLGFVDLQKQYESASIFVLSSRYEGFGMVLTEAMSQGCACIACDYKGRQREIITNDTQGIICPTDDEVSIANAIRRLIKDEAYRCELQKNAIERSKFYELPNIMNRWDEIFERIGIK